MSVGVRSDFSVDSNRRLELWRIKSVKRSKGEDKSRERKEIHETLEGNLSFYYYIGEYCNIIFKFLKGKKTPVKFLHLKNSRLGVYLFNTI